MRFSRAMGSQAIRAVVVAVIANGLGLVVMVSLTRAMAALENTEPVAKAPITFAPTPQPPPQPRKTTRRAPASLSSAPSTLAPPRLHSNLGTPPPAPPTQARWEGNPEPVELALGTQPWVFREDRVETPPRVVAPGPVRYPRFALDRKIEGHVDIRYVVGTKGEVVEAEVISAQPPGVFERAALAAARQDTFSPAKMNGRAVRSRARRRLTFELR